MEKGPAIMYFCDPEKNTECRKMGCAHTLTLDEGGTCFITFNRDYAMTYDNGIPITYDPERRAVYEWSQARMRFIRKDKETK